jgi:hypothetical protein
VDTVTYTVDSSYPLRLETEEVAPDGMLCSRPAPLLQEIIVKGDNCGGSYLNQNFKKLLEDRLQHETNLFRNGETKESIVNRLIPKFEDDLKRRIDVTKRCSSRIHIANLIGDEQRGPGEDDQKRFAANFLLLNRCVRSIWCSGTEIRCDSSFAETIMKRSLIRSWSECRRYLQNNSKWRLRKGKLSQ